MNNSETQFRESTMFIKSVQDRKYKTPKLHEIYQAILDYERVSMTATSMMQNDVTGNGTKETIV